MAAPRNWTDNELVKIIWDFRIAEGACTLGNLHRATGMSKSSLHARVAQLVVAGRVCQSETTGSLRGGDERIMRELPDGRIVEPKLRRRRY